MNTAIFDHQTHRKNIWGVKWKQ